MATETNPKAGSTLLDFTLQLYKEVLDEDQNCILSPFSISVALLLANLGSTGDTDMEVRKALGLETLSQTEVHEQFNAILDALNAQSKGSTTLETANRIYARLGLKVNAKYTNDSDKYYGSGLELMDFIKDGEGSRQMINKWVEQKTRDKIKDMLPSGIITADTPMVLVNAIYFKGEGQNSFEKRFTRNRQFRLTKSNTKAVKMMNDKRYVRFVQDDELPCTAIELPYEHDSVSIVFIRPDKVEGLKQLEEALTTSNFESLLNSLAKAGNSKVILGIPKFKMEATHALVPVLGRLGIKSMFVSGKADFTKMLPDNPDAFVSAVIHKAFVEVNEKGTKAATVPALRCMTPPPLQFILNRPFIFAIRDNVSGMILFMGRYSQPE